MLYLAATAAVLLAACGTLSEKERAALDAAPRGVMPRRALISRVLAAGIFAVLFGILALRVNVGNDYARYVEFMHLARVGAFVPTEIGFNLLARAAFALFGDKSFLVCFAVMAFVTVLCFLLAIDRLSERFFPSFAMFMLLGYYFQSISTVRYYLALAVVVFAASYLLRGDAPRFFLSVLFAACFHKSALVAALLYPLAKRRFRGFYAVLFAGGLAALIFRKWVLRLVLLLYPTYQETGYAAGGSGSLVSLFRCAAVLLAAFFLDRESFGESAPQGAQAGEPGAVTRRFCCGCNVLALALYAFLFYLPIVSRIGYYLTVTQIFYVPALLLRLPAGKRRRALGAAVWLFCAAVFAYTMRHAGDDGFRILPYQTFLFHDMPPIASETTGY